METFTPMDLGNNDGNEKAKQALSIPIKHTTIPHHTTDHNITSASQPRKLTLPTPFKGIYSWFDRQESSQNGYLEFNHGFKDKTN
ncbi:hypothetical protein E3Q17_04445 [Wallemia mellicola]|uniref:Uncharacterized protein n=1 Tax=Wallemia mellicola TaxID=1708541 RepID=A0A4T0NCJ0_9BASI|nr:hypothetical protein E3Q17_04445 [Wallemia mellicola]